jgi:hypothetical protein
MLSWLGQYCSQRGLLKTGRRGEKKRNRLVYRGHTHLYHSDSVLVGCVCLLASDWLNLLLDWPMASYEGVSCVRRGFRSSVRLYLF